MVIVDCIAIVLQYMHIWHLRIRASGLQFRASKINMATDLGSLHYNYFVNVIDYTVFTLNFLPYKPTRPVSSNIYRPTINSTGPNLKTTLMTINSNHQNSKHDDVPNIIWTCQLCIR